ncbi:MAG TPA: hypothetical protein PLB25_16165 [Rhodoferax sp.]|nr:hypothetical protein [Rhodoferax sp.]
MKKTCIKCNHVNLSATGDDTEACPACGVIYAKAQPPLARPAVTPSVKRAQRNEPFIDRLRDESLYPTFRQVVTIFHVLGQILAVLFFLGGLVSGYKMGNTGMMVGSTIGAIFMSVFFRVAKEASLMLADMSDATVRLAQRADADSSF